MFELLVFLSLYRAWVCLYFFWGVQWACVRACGRVNWDFKTGRGLSATGRFFEGSLGVGEGVWV